MTDRLKGKVALVTGASRGIGRAIALAFAREGAAVAVNYNHNHAEAHSVVELINERPGKAMSVQADVTNRASVEAMVHAVQKRFGSIDILVNNAGIWAPGTTSTFEARTLSDLLDTNLVGAINCAQAVIPMMIAKCYGKILNISSVGGLGMATPNNTPYSLSKAALNTLTKRLALELGPFNINVNAICPGLVRTDMMASEAASAITKSVLERTILSRAGTPDDIAQGAVFLTSDEAGFVTAQILVIDGGRTDFLSHSG